MIDSGAILVISGPSGAGKSSLINKISDKIGSYYFSISTTTRDPRGDEQNGCEYYFVTKDEFEKDIEANNFLEYATVHGNYYGTSMVPVKEALSEGKLVIFDIDVQGQKIVTDKLSDITTSVFLTTPSLNELKKRLYSRDTDDTEVIEKRLVQANEELEQIEHFDYLIVNDKLEDAAQELLYVAHVARLKNSNEQTRIFIDKWKR